ncbi:MAG TPA: S8 family serine peptidase, partial [Thermoanaerobaculia bacterium]|nr:S8 family serine peptidase [Thermoanaerobaculia bacterium]
RQPRRRDTPAPVPMARLSRLAAGRAADHVVVRFAAGVSDWQGAQVAQGLGGGQARPARHGGFTRVAVPPGTTPEELVARLVAHPSVLWAETDPLVRAAYREVARADATAPTDPLYPLQWHLQRIGTEEALERNPTDGGGVLVAVIDSGIAYGEGTAFPRRPAPDLEGTAFAPGRDFVDDDDEPFDEGTGDPDAPLTSPRFGHGTFAASVIAAQVDNGVAGASVAPRVVLLPVRVLGPTGFGSTSDVAEGIRFAVERGAKVINLSLGATRGSNAIREAVAEAHRRGVLLVAAAGNEADEGLFDDELGRDVAFPARYPEVIAVGATDFADDRAAYSNFGPSLDVMAPGGDGLEVLEGGRRDGVLATSFLRDPRTGDTVYGAFWSTGTSFAAPQVAGLAALLVGLGVDDPDDVRRMIEGTTRDLGAEGEDETFGHGLADAAAAHRGLGFTF